MTLLEPAVSLTDLGLAIENTVFAVLLTRLSVAQLTGRGWWILFFASLASAALLGFMTHGFFPDHSLPLYRHLWTATLLSIGCMALAATALAAILMFKPHVAAGIIWFAAFLLVPYGVAVISGYHHFGLAIAAYVPALVFLLTAFVVRLNKHYAHYWLAGITGLGLTAAAAAVQQLGLGLHPEHFNHNALYHVIQGVALWLLYLTARGSLRAGKYA